MRRRISTESSPRPEGATRRAASTCACSSSRCGRNTARAADAIGVVDSLGGVADETERVLRTMTVANALRTLSDPHREILIETYFKGRTVPEAAEVLGLPLGTAKSRVYYALRALRTALQQQGVTE